MIRRTFFVILIFAGLFAEAQTTLYIVRHAEKQATGADPQLIPEGEERANELLRVLNDVDIQQVYSTPYNRTRQTVLPLATSKGLEILSYNPMAPAELITAIENAGDAKLLIAGHSNTIPKLLNLLTGTDMYQQLDESDYDNLYIVDYCEGGVQVHLLEYGEDSPE